MKRADDDMRYPPELTGRVGFKNFTWTTEAIADWQPVWYALWACGIKWEWQNSDRYARRKGDTYLGVETGLSIVLLLVMMVYIPACLMIGLVKKR